jgi:hypothetical protein
MGVGHTMGHISERTEEELSTRNRCVGTPRYRFWDDLGKRIVYGRHRLEFAQHHFLTVIVRDHLNEEGCCRAIHQGNMNANCACPEADTMLLCTHNLASFRECLKAINSEIRLQTD